MTPVTRAADSSSPMHVNSHVVIVDDNGFTRVDTHANADRLPSRPGVPLQSPLALNRSQDRCLSTCKGNEEGVSLCTDLPAAELHNRGAQQFLVSGKSDAIVTAQEL